MESFRIPQPPQGWAALRWEVGVVFLGVLLALGAEQLADQAYWNQQVRDFRKALAIEIAITLGTYRYRHDQDAYVDRRIADLESWWQQWRTGRGQPLATKIGLPWSFAYPSSAWASRTPDVTGHLPLNERLVYARIYDEMANNNTHRLSERDAWIELAGYEAARQLDERDLIRIRILLNQVRLRQEWFAINSKRVERYAAKLGITARMDPSWSKPGPEICDRLLGRS